MPHPGARAGSPGLWALVLAQLALLAVLALVEFGYEAPGQFGLHLGHFLLTATVYAGLWLGGVVWAVCQRAWAAIAVVAVAPALVYAWVTRPFAPLDAAEHQGLVGMTRAEATGVLNGYRTRFLGERTDARGTALKYPGIDVHLADERRVTRIDPDLYVEPSRPTLDAADHQDLVGRPYPEVHRALVDRGGNYVGGVPDSTGSHDVYQWYEGIYVYLEGVERVRAVVPSADPSAAPW